MRLNNAFTHTHKLICRGCWFTYCRLFSNFLWCCLWHTATVPKIK